MTLLILRPEPGAAATVERARALGMHALAAPLFTVEAVAWQAPDASGFDAVMASSANTVRHGGNGVAHYRHLPAFAVGAASAAAMRGAGFCNVVEGEGDAAALLVRIGQSGRNRRVLHLCAEQRRSHVVPGVTVTEVPVYTSRAADRLSNEAAQACRAHATVLLHSPRAATVFATLLDQTHIPRSVIALVAISAAAADAAGTGWRSVAAASVPTDAAMLAIARALCDKAAP